MSLTRRKPCIWWSQYYEGMLFAMWEQNLSDLEPDSGKKNIEIYKMMAQKLKNAGFTGIEWKSVRSKLDNVTRKYRSEAKEPASNWIHFERLHKMLKHWRPDNPLNPAHQCEKKSFTDIKRESEETDYLHVYLEANGEQNEYSWEHQMDMSGQSGTLNGDQSPKAPPKKRRKSAAQDEMTAFEAGMLAASRERNKELKKLREELTDLGQRRLSIMERLERTMNRMEEENAKFHQQMLEKKS